MQCSAGGTATGDIENMIVGGSERFSDYSGYSRAGYYNNNGLYLKAKLIYN